MGPALLYAVREMSLVFIHLRRNQVLVPIFLSQTDEFPGSSGQVAVFSVTDAEVPGRMPQHRADRTMATMLGVLDVSRRMSGLKPACWNFWDSITSWIFRYVSFFKNKALLAPSI